MDTTSISWREDLRRECIGMVIEERSDTISPSDDDNDFEEMVENNIIDTPPPSASQVLAMLDKIQSFADCQPSEDLGIVVEKLITSVEKIRISEKKQSDIRNYFE